VRDSITRASIREWKSRLVLDPAEPVEIHNDSISVDADVCDDKPSDETTTDGYTSGDEPPGKRRRLDWI
jgi:hypothetical protein